MSHDPILNGGPPPAATQNSIPVTALVQRCILKNTPVDELRLPPQTAFFDAEEADDRLTRLDAEIESGLRRVVPFVSVEVAGLIQRRYPALARFLVFSPERLAFHAVSAVMGQALLNQRHLLVGWGNLPDRADDLERAFGPNLFVRPNAARKPFTGLRVATSRLRMEHAALSQTEHIASDELCVVAPAQELSRTEWRFWVVEGRPVTWAPYAWDEPAAGHSAGSELVDDPGPNASLPTAVADLARAAASRTEVIDSALVMDIGVCESGPAVVELNPLSTSGFYPGVNLAELLRSLADIFP